MPFNVVVQWSEFSRGGHFAAMEAPQELVIDVRAFFPSTPIRRLRPSSSECITKARGSVHIVVEDAQMGIVLDRRPASGFGNCYSD